MERGDEEKNNVYNICDNSSMITLGGFLSPQSIRMEKQLSILCSG